MIVDEIKELAGLFLHQIHVAYDVYLMGVLIGCLVYHLTFDISIGVNIHRISLTYVGLLYAFLNGKYS